MAFRHRRSYNLAASIVGIVVASNCATAPVAAPINQAAEAALLACRQKQTTHLEEQAACLEDWLIDYPRELHGNVVRYELANIWATAGSPGRATYLLQAILRSEPDFRLAQILLSRLENEPVPEKKGQEEEALSAPSPATAKTHARIEEPKVWIEISADSRLQIELTAGMISGTTGAIYLPDLRPIGLRTGSGDTEDIQLSCLACVFTAAGTVFEHDLRYFTKMGKWAVGLPIEEYLLGVIGSEMATGWPLEALKAQAVVSRTYAWNLYASSTTPVVLSPTTAHQVYKRSREVPEDIRASVLETRGQVLLYEGRPIVAYFHADNGGLSELPRFVWGNDLPYFDAVTDPYSNVVPVWTWKIGRDELKRKLARGLLPADATLGRVRLLRHNRSRIHKLVIETDSGDIEVRGNDFRLHVGPTQLRSLWFQIYAEDESYVFRGRGYGHGVGMSQWGARRRAESGQTFAEILDYYYENTDKQTVW